MKSRMGIQVIAGWMDGRMDGWMGGWMGGWVDGQTNGWTEQKDSDTSIIETSITNAEQLLDNSWDTLGTGRRYGGGGCSAGWGWPGAQPSRGCFI